MTSAIFPRISRPALRVLPPGLTIGQMAESETESWIAQLNINTLAANNENTSLSFMAFQEMHNKTQNKKRLIVYFLYFYIFFSFF